MDTINTSHDDGIIVSSTFFDKHIKIIHLHRFCDTYLSFLFYDVTKWIRMFNKKPSNDMYIVNDTIRSLIFDNLMKKYILQLLHVKISKLKVKENIIQ